MTDRAPHWLGTALESATSPLGRRQMTRQWWMGCCLFLLSWGPFAQTTSSPTAPSASIAAESAGIESLSNTTSNPPADLSDPKNNRTGSPKDKPNEPSQAWLSLSKRQKQALSPLSDKWDGLTPQQKQKWLTLARGFYQLTDPEQMVLHGRMREWAALSPRQRALARFNFNSTIALPIEDKLAQWAAYQQLTEDEKNKLTSGLKAPLKSAARSTAAPSKRLVKAPAIPADASRVFQSIAPRQAVHPNTLLPQPPG